MPKKLDMTEEQRINHIRMKDRERFKRYYDKQKEKNGEQFLQKRRDKNKEDKELRKQHPPAQQAPSQQAPAQQAPAQQAPAPAPAQEQDGAQLGGFKRMIVKKNNKKIGSYPIMTALEVQKIYKDNPQYALKSSSTERIGEKTFKEYLGGIPTVATIIDGKDNFIGAFIKVKSTVDLIKNKRKPDGTEYQPTSPQKWYETIFSVIRALKRAGYLNQLDTDTIIKDEYDSPYREYLLKKSIQKKKDADNIEFAVPTWDYFEAKIIEDFGANSIQHLITVLYRYNAVRNDFVKLTITNNKNNENGFYVPRTGNIKVLKNSHKSSGVGHSAIDFTYNKGASAVIRTYIKNNNFKVGDMLLPDSINNIVVDMLEKVHIKYPPTAKPVSVMRNIDSGVGDWNDIDTEDFVARAGRSKHSVATRLNVYRRVQKDFNVDYPLKSTLKNI